MDWALKKVCDLQSFQNAKRILEVGAGNFSRSASLAKAFPEKQIFAIDFNRSKQACEVIADNLTLTNFNPITFDCRRELFSENFFDFAFSIAVGEHILELDVFLEGLSKILRSGGSYYFIQSPMWTSYKGHHFKHSLDASVKLLGGYKHLLHDREGLYQYLLASEYPSILGDPEAICKRIYDRPDLSRLSNVETFSIFKKSPFEPILWDIMEDECFDMLSALKVEASSLNNYNVDDLRVKGVFAEVVNQK